MKTKWREELAKFQVEIDSGERKPPKADPFDPATLERSMDFAKFVLSHDDLREVIERRFIDQVDLEADARTLGAVQWYYQVKFGLDNLNRTGLVVVWGLISDIFSGKFSGLDDPNFVKEMETDIYTFANSSFRKKKNI